jgi:hypothetical protein
MLRRLARAKYSGHVFLGMPTIEMNDKRQSRNLFGQKTATLLRKNLQCGARCNSIANVAGHRHRYTLRADRTNRQAPAARSVATRKHQRRSGSTAAATPHSGFDEV